MRKDDKKENKSVVQRSGNHRITESTTSPLLTALSRFLLPSKNSQQTEELNEPKQNENEQGQTTPPPKNTISFIKMGIVAFCLFYMFQVLSLNTHMYGDLFGSKLLKELRPLIYIAGTIIIGVLLTKMSINIFGREKTNKYLPLAITAAFILFFFKGCVWFVENWCPGC